MFYQDLAVGSIVCRLEPASAPAPIDISTSISPPVLPVASSSSSTTVAVQRNHHEPHKLYIMTLGVLAPCQYRRPHYLTHTEVVTTMTDRRQGLASKLVRHIIEMAEASHRPPVAQVYKIKLSEKDKEAQKKATRSATTAAASGTVESKPLVTALYLHVQLGNDEAKAFWEGHGFRVTVSTSSSNVQGKELIFGWCRGRWRIITARSNRGQRGFSSGRLQRRPHS